uniref:BAR/IMD domain-containing adapter protein 2 n=1 Tax=Salmo trutta TaxID=8032 RepID=A0A673YMK4_SALTR
MVLTEDFKMSRTDEVHRITENVYKSIMEQFNPCLRNFVAMGKSYEKALSNVTFAAKGYFDALVRMGELASESQGSKDMGDVLFQMAEVHRQIQVQLEEMLKSFHNELLSELEKKVELDARYLTFVETISSKQSELDTFIAEGYKTALSEERRRYCFLVDRQCAVAKNSSAYHGKGKDLLTQKIPVWQQACSDPNKLPERAMLLAQQMGSGSSTGTASLTMGGSSPLNTSKSNLSNLVISDPIPGAQPLPVPPELAVFMGGGLGHQARLMGSDGMSMVNGTTGLHGEEEYWTEGGVSVSQLQGRPSSPQAPSLPQGQAPTQRQVSEHYSNTLPVRRPQPAKNKTSVGETRTLPRSSSMAAGLEKNGRARVQAIFSHAAGDNSTLLSFSEGDVITLLVPEARDGWHYGENEKNKMRGWFPFSYTRVLPESEKEKLQVNLHHGKSSSTGNLLESDMSLPMPDYGLTARLLAQSLAQSRPRPYSMAGFTTQPALEDYDSRFAAASDRALEIYFRQPINDDRSAPIFY